MLIEYVFILHNIFLIIKMFKYYIIICIMNATRNLSKNLIHINQNAWIKMNKIIKKTDSKNMGFL